MGRNLLLAIGSGALGIFAWLWLANDQVQSETTRPLAAGRANAQPDDGPARAPAPAGANTNATTTDADVAIAPATQRATTFAAELAHFNKWQSPAARAARQRIAARGDAALPEVIAALREASERVANIDRTDPGADRDAAEAALMQQNHLIGTVAAIGGDAAIEAILDTAGRMSPDSPIRGSIYAALDGMGRAKDADDHALGVIDNPASRGIELATALARFWLVTPAQAGRNLTSHYTTDAPQARALALKLAVNLGRGDEVRPLLARAVDEMRYAQPGNKQLLLALSHVEAQEQFASRLDSLRLRPTVLSTAKTYSRFLAADATARELMIPAMLRANDSELWMQALQHLVETGRTDLLARYQLVYIPIDPLRAYEQHIPSFSRMTREQRSRYLNAEELDRIEQAAANAPEIGFGGGVEKVLHALGYAATRSDAEITLNRRSP